MWLALGAWSKVSGLTTYCEILETFEPVSLEQMANFLVHWLRDDRHNFHWKPLLHEWATITARNGFQASPPIYGQKQSSFMARDGTTLIIRSILQLDG